MKLVIWLIGICCIIAACKFVFIVFKRLCSKENMYAAMDAAGTGIYKAARKVTNKIEEKREQKKKESRPIVTIR